MESVKRVRVKWESSGVGVSECGVELMMNGECVE